MTSWRDTLAPAVATKLTRGIAAYLRNADEADLPPQLRRLRNFAPARLRPHTRALLDALDDDVRRRLILQWLDKDKPRLGRDEAALLRIAVERPDGWEAMLAADHAEPAEVPRDDDPERLRGEVGKLRRDVDESRRRRASLKEELDAAKRALADEEARRVAAEREAAAARAALRRAEDQSAAEARRADQQVRAAARKEQRARDAAAAERAAAAEDRRQLRSLRAELGRAQRRIARLEERLRSLPTTGPARERQTTARVPLDVPLGRLEDDPETLDEWLTTPGVILLVDGYNVAKHPAGWGDLPLEDQRAQVVRVVEALAVAKSLEAIVVFDGADVAAPPASSRRAPVKVVYSKGDETGDDRLVAMLEALPPRPTVVVTSDRELRQRARAQGATVAGSDQLLALGR